MKSIVVKYGAYGFITAMVLFAMVLLLGHGLGQKNQEALTYGSMIVALSFVFFGIRAYKNENTGNLSFLKGLKLGVLISLFAALGIALMDILYTTVINPDWGSQYIESTLKNMRDLSSEAYETEKAALIKQLDDYGHPLFMGLLMFISTFIIGLIISLISAMILKSKN